MLLNRHYHAPAVIFLLALLLLPVPSVHANDWDQPLAKLSANLLRTIPKNKTLAMQEFTTTQTLLLQPITDSLYDQLINALVTIANRAGKGHVIHDRKNLLAILKKGDQFSPKSFKERLKAAAVDIVIFCTFSNHRQASVAISCNASAVNGGKILSSAKTSLPLQNSVTSFPFESALIALSGADWSLDGCLSPLSPSPGIFDPRGKSTGLAKLLTERLIESWTAQQRQAQAQPKPLHDTLTGTEHRPERVACHLSGTISSSDTHLELKAQLERPDSPPITHRVFIDPDTIPQDFTAGSLYQAEGRAKVSSTLDSAAATRAAKYLARARMIAEATGQPMPSRSPISSKSDTIALLQFLRYGIPHAETPQCRLHQKQARCHLSAQVFRIPDAAQSPLTARLNATAFEAGEPINIELQSNATVHLGIFSWGADDRIVRLYPNDKVPDLVLEKDKTLHLPHDHEDPIASYPLDDHHDDHEALLLIAGPTPLDYHQLAKKVGANLTETFDNSVEDAIFLDKLAGQWPPNTTLHILPYRVHRR